MNPQIRWVRTAEPWPARVASPKGMRERARSGAVETVDGPRVITSRDPAGLRHGRRARDDLGSRAAGISGRFEGDGRWRGRSGWADRGRPRPSWRRSRAARRPRARSPRPRVPPEAAAGALRSSAGPTCSSTRGPSTASAAGVDPTSTHRSRRRRVRSPGGRTGARNRPSPRQARSRPSPRASRTPRQVPSPAVSDGLPA